MAEALHPAVEKAGVTPGTPEAMLAVAKFFVDSGYQEGPNNDTVMGKWYGLNHNAWCAMFVSYCFNKSGAGKLIAGVQGPKGYASCSAATKYWNKKKMWVPLAEAKAGDIVFFDWDLNGDPDHTGVVVKNDPKAKIMITYEGNTAGNAKGSQSNGDGVYRKERPYKYIYAVVRPKWEGSASTAPAATVAPVAAPAPAPVAAAPVTTNAAPAAPAKPAAKVYTVKSGDTLSGIASKYKTTVANLQKLNGIKDASKISVGQKIKLG
jgi:LysM repeat protein